MKKITLTVPLEELAYEELSEGEKELVEAAKGATRTSWAPYSHFHVGAAIRMDDGSIHTGSNQENAAFSSGTCAERTAAFHASASHPGMPMRQLAISAWTKEGKPEGEEYDYYFQCDPIPPCGACRQALMEYENMHGPIELLLYGRDKIYRVASVADLLPLTFTKF